MFSFFQTIFHKVTTVIATAAIAIGFISAPEPPEQPVLDNQSPVVAEQQVKEHESQVQKKQTDVNISAETEKLKKEIESLKKGIGQQSQPPAIVNQPTQQSQIQKTVPPRPENSDEWTFNWNTWAWEKHPTAPPVASIISLPNSTQQVPTNQQVNYQNQSINLQITSVQVKTDIHSAIIEWQTSELTESKIFISADNFSTRVIPSESGLSSRHIANITSLLSNKNYSFEIEAIANNISLKKSGEFKILLKPAYTKDQWMIHFNTAGGEDYIKIAKLTHLFWDDIAKSWVDSSKIDYEVGEWMAIAQYNSELNGWFVTENGKIKGLQPKGLDRNSEYADRWGNLTIGYPSEWQIRMSDQAVRGLIWEVYFNGNLIAIIKNSSAEHLGSMGLVSRAQNGKIPLKSDAIYAYKIVAKEQDRDNSVYEGTFTTGTREWMERYNWPIEN